ncbi:hypothetical protein CCP3SC5AM1_150018 [Gammaproteobacteria bacterium]
MSDFSLVAYQPPTNLLRNHVILITGAGDGLGQATALAYMPPFEVRLEKLRRIERLVEVLADEPENESIHVNSLNPGRLRTLLRARAYPGENPNTVPAPETAVSALLYLLESESKQYAGKH